MEVSLSWIAMSFFYISNLLCQFWLAPSGEWYTPNLAPLNKNFNLLTWKVQRQRKMPIVTLDRLPNISFFDKKILLKSIKRGATKAFYLKKKKNLSTMRKKEAYLLWLWATREYCDLKVSNKVIIERVFSNMWKRLVNMWNQ